MCSSTPHLTVLLKSPLHFPSSPHVLWPWEEIHCCASPPVVLQPFSYETRTRYMGVLSMGGVKDWYCTFCTHTPHTHTHSFGCAYPFVMEFLMILRNISRPALCFHCTLRPHQDYGFIALQQNMQCNSSWDVQYLLYNMSALWELVYGTVYLLYES